MSRRSLAIYLGIICIQFGVIIGFMVHFSRQEARIQAALTDTMDWEQIANSYKQSATNYALSSEKCLRVVRDYHRSLFQPVEMGK